MLKKILSVMLCVLMVIGTLALSPVPAVAAETEEAVSGTAVMDNDIRMSSTNSLGAMLAAEYEDYEEENGIEDAATIYAVEMDGATAYVDLQVFADAELVVGIYSENGEHMYASGMTKVSSEDSVVSVELKTASMPEFYLVRAYLLDADTNIPLCKQFECNDYTEVMQEFYSKTTDDFEEEKVLNLDDSKEDNFLVYNDDTIVIENEDDSTNVVMTADEDEHLYVIENIDDSIADLQSGDIFSYVYGDDDILIIKVSSIDIDGTTATIRGDEIALEEAFDFIHIDVSDSTSDATVDNSELEDGIEFIGTEDDEDDLASSGVRLVDTGDVSIATSLKYKIAEKEFSDKSKISGTVGCKFTVEFKCLYDAKLFEEDKVELSFAIKYEASISVKLSLKADKKIKLGFVGFSPIPGVYVDFTPSIVFEGSISIEVDGKLSGQVGKKFEDGKFVDNSKKASFKAEFSFEGEIFIGLSLEPKIGVVGDVIAASMEAKVGVFVKGKLERSASTAEETEKHLCSVCVDGELYFGLEVSFKLKLLCGKLEWTAAALKIKEKISDFYFSFDTGKFGFSKCPNKSYRQTVTVIDTSHHAVSGADVNGVKTNKNGVADVFIKSGNSVLTVKKSGYVDQSTDISVSKADQHTVILYKPGESVKLPFDVRISKINRNLSLYDVFQFDGHYYKLFDSVCSTWEVAKTYCEKLGGHLATIRDSRENAALYQYITETSYENAYFGYTDSVEEGVWKWENGESITYTNWAAGEPNDIDNEDYAMFYWKFSDGAWNDGNFGQGTEADQKVFLCEWENKESYDNGLKLLIANSLAESSGMQLVESGQLSESGSVERAHLVSGTEAVLMIVRGTSDQYIVSNEDLLYIAQTVVNEDGEASFGYFDMPDDESWVALVFGECSHDDCRWTTVSSPTLHDTGRSLSVCQLCGAVVDEQEVLAVEIEKAEDEIQIFFINNENWETVNVHYWGNGETSWPGIEMKATGIYKDSAEVYTAVIPDRLDGIVISGPSGSPQTVDIISGLEDYAVWTLTEEEYSDMWMVEEYEGSLFEEIILGDADGDGTVTILDATQIQRKLAQLPVVVSFNVKAACVDGDSGLNILHATFIQKWLASLPVSYPIGIPMS